jgi:hypothetical protein
MNPRAIPTWALANRAGAQSPDQSHSGHEPTWQSAMSRRQFARRAARAAVVGAALGSGWLRPALAGGRPSNAPVPIPGGTPLLGGAFHLFGPTPDGSFDPIDAEPSTITDFNGVVGLAYIDGMVTRTNTATGEVSRLPTIFSDMRLMQGVFRGDDGRLRQGAFALI